MDAEKLSSLFDLTGRVAIVTGATRGIGRAVAEGFLLSGADVVVTSRKGGPAVMAENGLNQLAKESEGSGRAHGIGAHMGELDDIQRLVDTTVDELGRIDIVVNNAATSLAQPVGQLTPEAWAKVYDVNLRGPVFLVQAALPHLAASEHASVINVISVGAFLFSPMTGMYAGAKAALMAYTRSMAADLTHKGIRCNALAPGTVDTQMVRNNPPEVQESMAKASLLGRSADPDEMVGPALLLASDAGSFMNGQVVIVDGGLAPH